MVAIGGTVRSEGAEAGPEPASLCSLRVAASVASFSGVGLLSLPGSTWSLFCKALELSHRGWAPEETAQN